MKRLLSLITVLLIAVTGMLGQSPAPGILNYQGVARNSVGNVLVNKTITLRLTIRDGAAAGPTVYQESRTVTTNPFGLFNVQLGSAGASSVTGTIAGVPWGVGLKYIQVEIDPNGGSTFINIGTAQLASVPYSLYSSQSNDLVLPFDKTQADAGTLFRITNSGTASGSRALEGLTNSTAGNAFAVVGTVTSGSPGGFSSGVRGINNGTGGLGIGVWGSQAGTGYGVYGTTPGGWAVRGEATTGVGVYGQSGSGTGGRFVSSSGLALHTSGGGVRLQNINEGVNRILATIPGDGTATWQDPSAVGIVTGSGTLNYVPKWTPNGTNLGNSQIFDNGTSVGINTNTPNAAHRLEVEGIQRINNTTLQEGGELRFEEGTLFGAPNHWIIDNFQSIAGGNKFRLWNDVGGMNIQMMPGGRTAIGNMVFSDQPQSTLDVEGNLAVGAAYSGTTAAPANGAIIQGSVGIGTAAPSTQTKLHVDGQGTTGFPYGIMATSRTGTTNVNTHGVWADGSWRGVYGTNLSTVTRGRSIGVMGIAAGTSYVIEGVGVWAEANGTGTAGVNNYGLYATASNAAGNNYAAWLNGRVAITDGTQGLNRVFTSDANGNGSWQPLAAIGIVGGTGTLNRVAKWTPDGFNIGNSLQWDDGNRVRTGLGPTYGDNNTLTITTTSATGSNAVLSLQGQAGDGNTSGVYMENAVNKTHLTVNDYNTVNGTKVMTWDGGSLNVGIGTVSPAARLHALSAPATGGPDAILGESNNTDASAVAIRGVITSNTPGAFSSALRGVNNGTGGLGIGIYGSQAGSGWGVYGTTPSGLGVYGNSNTGTGVYGLSSSGTGVFGTSNTGFAGNFNVGNAASVTAALRGFHAGNNVGSWGVNAISQTGTGYPGEATHAGLVAASLDGVGTVTSSPNNYGLRSGSISNHAIYGENYGGGGFAGVFGVSLNGTGYGVAGNVPAGTGAGGYFTGGTTALRTLGGLQLTGINEAPNRILTTVPGTGQATWEDAATVGIVSGSGTLNYVPKWTPNGTTLGNSLMFDDGNRMQVGGNIIGGSSFGINPTPGSALPSLTWYKQATGNAFNIHQTDDGSLHIEANNTAAGAGSKIMTFDDDNLSVGIGTTTPSAKLNVVQTDVTSVRSEVAYTGVANIFSYRAANLFNNTNSNYGLAAFNNHSPDLMPGWKAAVMGVDSSNDIFASGVAGFYKGNVAGIGVYGASSQDRNYSVIATTSTLGFIAGHFRGADVGIHASSGLGTGTSADKYGIYTVGSGAGTNSYGIYALSGTGATNNWAGFFDGRVAIVDGTEGAGKVLTSDASGNASWQAPVKVGISVQGLLGGITVPSGNVITDIVNWSTVLYENGGANFNPVTGEYTITVTGNYDVSASVFWDPHTANSPTTGILLMVNGNYVKFDYTNGGVGNFFTSSLSQVRRFNAGDVVKISVVQTSGVNQNVSAAFSPLGTTLSINYINN